MKAVSRSFTAAYASVFGADRESNRSNTNRTENTNPPTGTKHGASQLLFTWHCSAVTLLLISATGALGFFARLTRRARPGYEQFGSISLLGERNASQWRDSYAGYNPRTAPDETYGQRRGPKVESRTGFEIHEVFRA